MPPARFFIWLESSSSRAGMPRSPPLESNLQHLLILVRENVRSMRTLTICFWPFIFTVTIPPPADASTVTEFTCSAGLPAVAGIAKASVGER